MKRVHFNELKGQNQKHLFMKKALYIKRRDVFKDRVQTNVTITCVFIHCAQTPPTGLSVVQENLQNNSNCPVFLKPPYFWAVGHTVKQLHRLFTLASVSVSQREARGPGRNGSAPSGEGGTDPTLRVSDSMFESPAEMLLQVFLWHCSEWPLEALNQTVTQCCFNFETLQSNFHPNSNWPFFVKCQIIRLIWK